MAVPFDHGQDELVSNKSFDELNDIDRKLRQAFPAGMCDSTIVQLKIEKICGFELFNTRQYHNYETWSDGWRISKDDIVVEAEDLDDAVDKFLIKQNEKKNI